MFAMPGFTQSAADSSTAATFSSFIPLILIFFIMYFLLIRPQQKKAKQHATMVAALRRGDQVITQGGIYGKVTHVNDDNTVQIEIADGVKVRALRQTIVSVVNKTEPVVK